MLQVHICAALQHGAITRLSQQSLTAAKQSQARPSPGIVMRSHGALRCALGPLSINYRYRTPAHLFQRTDVPFRPIRTSHMAITPLCGQRGCASLLHPNEHLLNNRWIRFPGHQDCTLPMVWSLTHRGVLMGLRPSSWACL